MLSVLNYRNLEACFDYYNLYLYITSSVLISILQIYIFYFGFCAIKNFINQKSKINTDIYLKERIFALIVDLGITFFVCVLSPVFMSLIFKSKIGYFLSFIPFFIYLLLRDFYKSIFGVGKRLNKIMIIDKGKKGSVSLLISIFRNMPISMYFLTMIVFASPEQQGNYFGQIFNLLILVYFFIEYFHLKKYGIRIVDSYLNVELVKKD